MVLAPEPGVRKASRTYEIDVVGTWGRVGLSGRVLCLAESGDAELVKANDPDLRIGRELSDVGDGASRTGQRRWRVVDIRNEKSVTVFDFMAVGQSS